MKSSRIVYTLYAKKTQQKQLIRNSSNEATYRDSLHSNFK